MGNLSGAHHRIDYKVNVSIGDNITKRALQVSIPRYVGRVWSSDPSLNIRRRANYTLGEGSVGVNHSMRGIGFNQQTKYIVMSATSPG
jgi:hypothetical protein